MGARPMEREERVEYWTGDRYGWRAPDLAGVKDRWEEWGYPTRTVERFVTPWTPVAEGKQ